MPSSRVWIAALWLALSAQAGAQTFGQVVSLGGMTSDLVLDEARHSVYVANFTANRIDVVNMDTGAFQRSINVTSQPSSLALTPDGRYLVIAHYGNFVSPGTPSNAITIIDMTTRAKRTFGLAQPPFGVAIGIDGQALVVTATQFLLLDPELGTVQQLATISEIIAKTLPQPPANAPTQIVGASVQSSADLRWIHGVTDQILFSYDVVNRRVYSGGYVAEPPLGPRAVSVAKDGSYYMAGWASFDLHGSLDQFPSPMGLLYIGSHAIDSERGIVYSEVPSTKDLPEDSAATVPDPVFTIANADGLGVREKLSLPEHLAGKSLLNSDGTRLFSLSQSGLMILPVGELGSQPRVVALSEDLVFRSNSCNPGVLSQEVAIVDPGGGNTPFLLSTTMTGVRLSASSGTTPMVIRVSIDPSAYQNLRGTLAGTIKITSPLAVNIPNPIRLLVNLRDPDQRGTTVDVPGKLVDILADPYRSRFFILRQDTNQVLVYDGATYQQIATLGTGNTPTSLAFTFDRKYLLVGHDNSQYASVFDLDTLERSAPIRFPFGHYPRSLASSAKALLGASRVAGPNHTIDRVDFLTRRATQLPSLGVFENKINLNTVLVGTPNGSSIMAAEADGNVLLYNASADTFTISRKDVTKLAGAFAASSFDRFVIGSTLFNGSLVPVRKFDDSVGTSSGFAFYDQSGFRTGSTTASSPGLIQRVDMTSSTPTSPTRISEAPLLGSTDYAFTRTLALLPDRSAVVSLTTSGFTILAWNYDADAAIPFITSVTNAADKTAAVAPGGLIIVRGENLTPLNSASADVPISSAMSESCLTVNGLSVPMIMANSTQINAQLPFQAEGNMTLVLRTPGGVSDSYNLTILPTAPSVFRTQLAADYEVPTVVRLANSQVVTPANPVRGNDELFIYLTGMGKTYPEIDAGQPAPADAPVTLTAPVVDINGYSLPVVSSELVPGQMGVYSVHVKVPFKVPTGLHQSLKIRQGSYSSSVDVRVIQ